MTGDGAPTARARRFDPGRRERILDACLDVIVAVGVFGVSHRKVAAAADVPLGSMTYHFTGMDDLLMAAFDRYATQAGDRFEVMMATATPEEAPGAVVALVEGTVSDRRDLILTTELYALAARDERFREITHAWMARSRAALGRHFAPERVRILDALIEGLSLHRALDDGKGLPADVQTAVALVLTP